MSVMKSELLVTKTRLPQLPLDWIARPYLSSKLIEALRHKVVLVLAPAGYGKTTMVIEALRDTKQPVGWVSLDFADNIPGNFLTYFVTALQSVVPEIGQPILNALQSPQPPPTNLLLTALVNSISARKEDFVLVLDDYHTIESQAVHDAVTFIVEHLPQQFHLIIASRIDPPLPLARWRVNGVIAEIRADDLSFTNEEAEAFFKKITGAALSEKDIATLQNRTEGWVAGLKMTALSLRVKKEISAYISVFSGSNRYVLDYLAEEVLNHQSANTRQFLLETSILERVCGPLCDAVTERRDSQSMLVQVDTHGQSPWHFTGQASLDLNPGPPAISHTH
jgi:LuxR family maltose regulon positive regulatory protein